MSMDVIYDEYIPFHPYLYKLQGRAMHRLAYHPALSSSTSNPPWPTSNISVPTLGLMPGLWASTRTHTHSASITSQVMTSNFPNGCVEKLYLYLEVPHRSFWLPALALLGLLLPPAGRKQVLIHMDRISGCHRFLLSDQTLNTAHRIMFG